MPRFFARPAVAGRSVTLMTEHKEQLTLPRAALERLLSAHDGDLALLYLYLLCGGSAEVEQAAGALCRTAREIEAAGEKLARMGLLPTAPSGDPERLLPPEDHLPEYTAGDLVRFAEETPQLEAIYREAAQVFGHKLSSADMKMLAGVYKHLGLPAEVVFELLHYCAERAVAQKPGSVPSPRSVEKEAYAWANREILTLEQAEAYIRFRHERRSQLGQLREILNIRDRDFTKTERGYAESWLDLGFAPDAIAIAYDRTITNTGSLRWPYLNKILLIWHEKKLHSVEEIEAQDGSRKPGRNSGKASRATAADYIFPEDI